MRERLGKDYSVKSIICFNGYDVFLFSCNYNL
jgi:hypothetical protein